MLSRIIVSLQDKYKAIMAAPKTPGADASEHKVSGEEKLDDLIVRTQPHQNSMLEFAVAQSLSCAAEEKPSWSKVIDAYLKQLANPHAAVVMLCAAIPITKENILLAAKFVAHMQQNKFAVPVADLLKMFNKLFLTENFLQGIFFLAFRRLLDNPDLNQNMESVIHTNQQMLLRQLVNNNERAAAFDILDVFVGIRPDVVLMPDLLPKLAKQNLAGSHEDVKLFWELVKRFPLQMNRFYVDYREEFLAALTAPENSFAAQNREFLRGKKEFTVKEAADFLMKKDAKLFSAEVSLSSSVELSPSENKQGEAASNPSALPTLSLTKQAT